MAHSSFRNLGTPLLLLLAMGNWGNTPTPPLDSDAPDSVGNEGELVLEFDGERKTYRVQAASLSGGTLSIHGENVDGQSQFLLSLTLPEGISGSDGIDAQVLRQATLAVASSSYVVDPTGQKSPVTGGAVRVSRASGSGPWEIDGDVEIATDTGLATGTLEARVRD